MTSCGFIDTVLYTLTRRVLVREIGDASTRPSLSAAERTAATRTILAGDDRKVIILGKRSKKTQGTNPSDSTEDIWNIINTESFEAKSDTEHQPRASASTVEEYR